MKLSQITISMKTVKIITFIFFILGSISLPFQTITTQLDPSWIYAINLDYIWGKDFVITYGPLGYLLYTVNINSHILIASCFWIIIFAITGWAFYTLLFNTKCSLFENERMLLVAGILYFISGSIISLEFFYCFLAMLLLYLSYKVSKKYIWIVNMMLVFSFYMKTTLCVEILTGILLFLIASLIAKDQNVRYYFISLLLAVIALPITFLLLYCHEWKTFTDYIYGSLEVASGFTAAMSFSFLDHFAGWIIPIMVAYVSATVILILKKHSNSILFITLSGPLFFVYKQGFVRADSFHTFKSFAFLLMEMSLMLIAIDWNVLKKEWKKSIRLIFTGLISFIIFACFICNGKNYTYHLTQKYLYMMNIGQAIKEQTTEELSKLEPLPSEFLDLIQDETVSIYPWEISYAASNDINYVPLPALQAYSAYTPYLDKKDADFYSKEDAPKYIVFSLDSIDNRWPLLECPQTWNAILNHYEYVMVKDGLFLLCKKENAEESTYTLLSEMNVSKNDNFILSDSEQSYYKIYSKLSFWGQCIKLLWKIPEVTMTVQYQNGCVCTKRILMDNLSGGICLDNIPYPNDNESFLKMMRGDKKEFAVKSISFGGTGLKYYDNDIIIEVFKAD